MYSVGSNGEIEFESAIFNELNIESYTFDPTLTAANLEFVTKQRFIHFSEVGLTGEANVSKALESLSARTTLSPNATMMNIIEMMGIHKHNYVDVFKVDCEGCETSFIPNLKENSSRQKPLFGQLLIEFHRLDDVIITLPMLEILENLGYRLFHSEPNYYYMNCAWELSYIHETVIFNALRKSRY